MSALYTKADCMVWQRQAAAALHEMLDEAALIGLPLVLWKLGIAGTLMGHCIDGDMRARRAAFESWTSYLGIAGWRVWKGDGVLHLYGITGDFRGCQVSMAADLIGVEPGDPS